jgi:hypothetical protein
MDKQQFIEAIHFTMDFITFVYDYIDETEFYF